MTREERIAAEVSDLFGEYAPDLDLGYGYLRGAYQARNRAPRRGGQTHSHRLWDARVDAEIRALRSFRKAIDERPKYPAICGVYVPRAKRAA